MHTLSIELVEAILKSHCELFSYAWCDLVWLSTSVRTARWFSIDKSSNACVRTLNRDIHQQRKAKWPLRVTSDQIHSYWRVCSIETCLSCFFVLSIWIKSSPNKIHRHILNARWEFLVGWLANVWKLQLVMPMIQYRCSCSFKFGANSRRKTRVMHTNRITKSISIEQWKRWCCRFSRSIY
jgi:hypothetical protein